MNTQQSPPRNNINIINNNSSSSSSNTTTTAAVPAIPRKEELYEVSKIKRCIREAGGPCTIEYIAQTTGYNLRDPAQDNVYRYFIEASKEEGVEKYEYNARNETFEYKKAYPVTTVDGLMKHLEASDDARVKGVSVKELTDVLCPESVVLGAVEAKKVIPQYGPEKKLLRILYFKEDEDVKTLPRKKDVRREFNKTMNSVADNDKKVEELLRKRGLFVFAKEEEKVVQQRQKRGRPSNASKKTSK